MKISNIYIALLGIFLLYSCETVSSVRLIKDRAKNIETYYYKIDKSTLSEILRNVQQFQIEFIKSSPHEDKMEIFITLKRHPTIPELSPEVYLINASKSYVNTLEKVRQIAVNENNVTHHTQTTYQTTTQHIPKTTTVEKIVDDKKVIETTTETEVVNTSVPVQNNYQQTVTNNYISERYRILIDQNELRTLCLLPTFSFRLYNTDNDFWNIALSTYQVSQIRNLLNNTVNPYNIKHN